VPRSDRACVFTKRCLRSENAGFTKSRRVIAQQVLYPWLGIKREEQDDGWGAEGKSGRVKFLPLAWAGMPKTSFRKNSDSPKPKMRGISFIYLSPGSLNPSNR
ncbi:MAG: hypothetical protein ACXWTN_11260, partial [Methylosarcina sp.]